MRPDRMRLIVVPLLCLLAIAKAEPAPIVVGSKTFTESYLLAEIMAQLLDSRGFAVERQFGFGGTLICFQALRAGEIDVYPEYSGTISETILHDGAHPSGEAGELAAMGLETLPAFGFDNTYALAVTAATARDLHLRSISDLRAHPRLRIGLSHEFRERPDGWPGLERVYSLPQRSSAIEHGLAYQALAEGKIDVTDAYSTDGDLAKYELVVLDDDRGYFPSYRALPLARRQIPQHAKQVLALLGGRLDDARMRSLNAEVAVDGRRFAEVARRFLRDEGLVRRPTATSASDLWPSLLHNTLVHLKLTGIAVLAACVAGLGLAVTVYRSRPASTAVLYIAGLLQTIPSIALLALLIPFAGVGQLPAVIALFLYSLLPIARNAITALLTIDPLLRRVASAIGLTHWERLKYVYIPLALPHVLSGLRIAAVVSIGTATLAAFIGAGGLGDPIVTGLALNDTGLILQGAVPAALLALATELVFEGLERVLVPRHLLARQLSA
jgi:osmoprotectant transport system permease protein